MANGKTMQAVVNLAGSIDPSLGKAIEQAQKKISGLNVKALAVGAVSYTHLTLPTIYSV